VRAWAQAWELIRDVGLTGFGIYLVALQSFSAHPSDALILAGVGLAVPAVRGNLKALLGGRPVGRHRGRRRVLGRLRRRRRLGRLPVSEPRMSRCARSAVLFL